MVKTKEELIKLVPHFEIGDLMSSYSNIPLFYWNNETFYKTTAKMKFIRLTDEQAIDLYNKQQFVKDFIDKL